MSESQRQTIELPSAGLRRMVVRIEGVTPLLQNRWRPSVVGGMRDKQEGKAKKSKEARDPKAEMKEILAAATISENGKKSYGHPREALVEAMASAGHRLLPDLWKNKGPTIKGSVTILGDHDLVPILKGEPVLDTRPVRIKGTWTIAHRPRYDRWAMEFAVEFDTGVFTDETFLQLLQAAGRGVGIGSFRVERGGQYGRFDVVSAEIEGPTHA